MPFDIYKRGQGKYTRLGSAFGAVIIVGLGCLQLYKKLDAAEIGLSPKIELWVVTMVPVCLAVALAILTFWLINRPSVSDFMISAEGEMKKVSWSSKKEIAVSTFIVIVVVVVIAALLGIVDVGFEIFFSNVIGI